LRVNDLSYHPHDPLFDAPNLPGVQWGVQLFTTHNLYGLNPTQTRLTPEEDGVRLVCEGLSWAGQQQHADGRVEARLRWQEGVLTWQVQAWHAEPIKAIKLVLWGLPESALEQGWWHATTEQDVLVPVTADAPLHWTYPHGWDWLTPWACAGSEGNAVCLSIRDPEVREKRLYVYPAAYAEGRTVAELICDQDAMRYGDHFAAPEMRLRLCETQAAVDADFGAHLQFIEGAYGLRPWASRPDVADWMRDIRLVLNLHGQHWTGYVFNSFDRMAETLRFVTEHIPAHQVAAYLPGWEGRYYYSYPWFQPGEDMGGDAGFRRLVTAAQELGVRLMPMFGMHGANIQRYPDWERAVFRNRTNRYAVLFNKPDWDGDRSGEDDQVFLNPGEPRYRQHLIDQISAAITSYDLEIVYLDTTAAWFNDPRYNLYAGYTTLLRELRDRHPEVMVAGEGWTDALLALFPINLSWLGITRHFRYPALLAHYGRALQHLNEGAPGLGSTGVYEGGYTPIERRRPTPGHIPSISIVDDTLACCRDDIIRICRDAQHQ
jgi:hypothetical protein